MILIIFSFHYIKYVISVSVDFVTSMYLSITL